MLKFRNIDATPDQPVARWGFEGVLTAMERGGLAHLRRITDAVLADPFGDVADSVLVAAGLLSRPSAAALARIVHEARGGVSATVARRVRSALVRSGLTYRQAAAELGTSASRLSSYATGATMPSAGALLRIEALADPRALPVVCP